jgi:Tol biopolymer transport system component
MVIYSIAYYAKKGKLHYFLIPLLLVLCFTGGILTGRNSSHKENDLSSLYPLDRNTLEKIEPSFIGLNVNYQPSLSKDGRYVAFASINIEVNKIKDIEVKLYDTKTRKYVVLPGINSRGWDLAPSITADGRYIAFQSNRDGVTQWNIYLYDVEGKKFVEVPNLNSPFPDFNPSISPEGNFITFNSLRSLVPKVYLYSMEEKKIKPLMEDNME